jgi:hypothetical protein
MRFAATLTALFVLAFAPAASAAPDNWFTFTDSTGTFSISVPSQPQIKSKSTTTDAGHEIPLTEYLIDGGDIALMVMVGDYAGLNLDSSTALDNAIAGVQKDNPTPLTDTLVTVNGHVGRDVTWHDGDGDAFSDRMFFFNNHLYQVLTVMPGKPTDDQRNMAERFTQSFHFFD